MLRDARGRLILTFATGAAKYAEMAKALAVTLDLRSSEVPRAIITDRQDPELDHLYAQRLKPVPGYDHWFTKLCALEATDAERILFIDGDSLAIGDVDAIFDTLEGSDFAVQGGMIEGGHWYGDIGAAMRKLGVTSIPKFSGGFLYYERTPAAERLIRRTMELAADYESLGLQRNGGKVVDEVCIALAMAETGVGKAFPDRHSFSLTPWGCIGDFHLDAIRGECHFLKGFDPPRSRRPIIYHSATANFDVDYWREVGRVMRLYRDTRALAGKDTSVVSRYSRLRHLKSLFIQRRIR